MGKKVHWINKILKNILPQMPISMNCTANQVIGGLSGRQLSTNNICVLTECILM